jgi:hypothetical protein
VDIRSVITIPTPQPEIELWLAPTEVPVPQNKIERVLSVLFPVQPLFVERWKEFLHDGYGYIRKYM